MKKLHIIPHTHWDREWYMPFEQHRYRLVELFDDLLTMFKTNPNYKSFHMDGQVIPVLDYLEVKPHKREEIIRLIEEDKLHIGPFYILQDEFLISAESNVRNIIYGLKECEKLNAKPVLTGYFPDSFGNIAQAPQILNGFNIHTAAFGRGMNEIGFNNEIVEQKGINKSEVNWQSPDGSSVACVMFANWYCNAWDMPKDISQSSERFREIFKNAEPLSHLNDLLGMNGCDHTPLEKNLSELINKANEEQDEFEVIHSNFKDYLEIIEANKSLYETVEGEITGQLTTGEHLLINTASSRVDIKQLNYKTQHALEKILEPTYALANIFNEFDSKDYIDYCWKLLLENHPHDSICTCSVDEVHDEMITRFNKVLHASEVITQEAFNALNKTFDLSILKGKGLSVINGTQHHHNGIVKGYVDFDEAQKVKDVRVYTLEGTEVPAKKHIKRHVFTYTLPKDKFRQVKYVDRVYLEFEAKSVPAFGYTTYDVVPAEKQNSQEAPITNRFENKNIRLEFEKDGSFYIIDKTTNVKTGPLNVYEYSADIGNEYNFVQSIDKKTLTTKDHIAHIGQIENDAIKQTVYIKNELTIPQGVKDGKTVDETTTLPILTKIELYHHDHGVRLTTTLENNAENLRIRTLNAHDISTHSVQAEGQYNVISRPIQPWEGWKNPENHQRHHGYFYVNDDNKGLIISGRGLHEHEAMRHNNNTLALTLLRGVGELGDWGIFPTPNSQMKKRITLEYYIEAFDSKALYNAQVRAQTYHDQPLISFPLSDDSKGDTPLSFSLIATNDKRIETTAYKVSEDKKSLIVRFYNKTSSPIKVAFKGDESVSEIGETTLKEDTFSKIPMTDSTFNVPFNSKEIKTLSIKI